MPHRPSGITSLFGLRSVNRFRNNPMPFLRGLAREYGDIAYFGVGPLQGVLVNSPDLVREILVKQKDNFPKSGTQRKVIRRIDGNSLFVKHGQQWLADRRMIQAELHPDRMSLYADKMVIETGRRADSWLDDSVMNFEDEMIEMSIMITGRLFFDTDLAPDVASFREAVYERSLLFMKEMRSPVSIPDNWPLPSKRKKKWLIQKMDDLIYGVINRKRSEGLVGNDFVSNMLRSVADTPDGNQQIRDHLNMVFFAGADDVSSALAWLFYLIARHPQIQVKLRKEIAQNVGARGLTASDLPNLKLLENVVKENLRLYPPTWLFTARKARQDVLVGGHKIKRRSWVFISPYVTHRDARFFEDPDEFLPERFDSLQGGRFEKNAYFPFGMGVRACAAASFATMQLILVAATVLQRFQLELEPGQESIKPSAMVTMRPKGGVRIRVRKMASTHAQVA